MRRPGALQLEAKADLVVDGCKVGDVGRHVDARARAAGVEPLRLDRYAVDPKCKLPKGAGRHGGGWPNDRGETHQVGAGVLHVAALADGDVIADPQREEDPRNV